MVFFPPFFSCEPGVSNLVEKYILPSKKLSEAANTVDDVF